MRIANNYSTLTDPMYGVVERDGFVCNHCQKIVTVMPLQPAEDMGGLCKVCDGLICPKCYDDRMAKGITCVTWEAQLELIESRDRFLRSAGIIQ